MIYKVEATFLEDKAFEFFKKLTDGTIARQKPDGEEIVASMKRATISQSGTIEWYETCYCPTPLYHERTTQYDHYFTNLTTEEVADYGETNGESFWSHLKSNATR